MNKMNKMNELKRGVVVFVLLAVLTGIEFAFALLEVSFILLGLIALAKAIAVLWYFMHLPRVFTPPSEGGHE
ncbi:MAG: hypothetical protein EHM21_04600 [Chloroflexi bacterium]|nr:MAG: hypothetical protein EHM21_04600 [Chloroflexota bacterium]